MSEGKTVVQFGRDPGGKVTLFDIWMFFGSVTGMVLTFRCVGRFCAASHMGIAWSLLIATVAAIPGAYLGWALGRIPYAITFGRLLESLKRSDTPTLWKRLGEEWHISHYIAFELLARKESATALQRQVLSMMLAESSEQRWQGWRTLSMCFPELAQRLNGFNPDGAVEIDRSRIDEILGGLP